MSSSHQQPNTPLIIMPPSIFRATKTMADKDFPDLANLDSFENSISLCSDDYSHNISEGISTIPATTKKRRKSFLKRISKRLVNTSSSKNDSSQPDAGAKRKSRIRRMFGKFLLKGAKKRSSTITTTSSLDLLQNVVADMRLIVNDLDLPVKCDSSSGSSSGRFLEVEELEEFLPAAQEKTPQDVSDCKSHDSYGGELVEEEALVPTAEEVSTSEVSMDAHLQDIMDAHLQDMNQPKILHECDDYSIDSCELFDEPEGPPPAKPLLAAAVKAKQQADEQAAQELSAADTITDTHLKDMNQPKTLQEYDNYSIDSCDLFDEPEGPPSAKPLLAAALKAMQQVEQQSAQSASVESRKKKAAFKRDDFFAVTLLLSLIILLMTPFSSNGAPTAIAQTAAPLVNTKPKNRFAKWKANKEAKN